MTYRWFLFLLSVLTLSGRSYAQPGSKQWDFPTGADILASPAVANDGTIYIGSYDQALYAINPTNGVQVWRLSVDPNVNRERAGLFSSPAIGPDGTIYFGTDQRSTSSGQAIGKLYAVKPDGTIKWSVTLPDSVYSDPAVGPDGSIYVGCYDDYLYAFNPNGTEKWKYQAGDSIYSEAVLAADGTLYFGCDNGKLYALDPNGTKKWEFTTGVKAITASPAVGADGVVYVGVGSVFNPKMFAVNPDGTKKWEFATGGQVNSSAAIGADGTIYFGSGDHKVYALNPDGTKKWDFTTGAAVRSSPALAAGGRVYVGSDDGVVHALDAQGVQRWQFPTGGGVYSSPTVARDGTVYVGSGDGRLYALRGEAGGLSIAPWPMFRKNTSHTAKCFPAPRVVLVVGANGVPQLTLFGEVGQNIEIESSSDLASWQWFGRIVSMTGTTMLWDERSSGAGQRFYRVWSR